jgi:RNA polymerase sigma-70 factor (ECF subfamily)
MIGDRMSCEDIIQNVFVKFFENLELIRNSNSINFWLFKTTRNEIFSYYRKKKTHPDQFKVDDTDELEIDSKFRIEEELEHKELNEIIRAELDKMAIEQRDVFLLKEYGGLSYKEIALVMSIDENLVKSRLFKVRNRLIDKLSKCINL